MYQAIEATCRAGKIIPLEPVQFEENEHLVIVRIPANTAAPAGAVGAVDVADWQSFVGVLKDSAHLNGDPLAIQAAMRNEWD